MDVIGFFHSSSSVLPFTMLRATSNTIAAIATTAATRIALADRRYLDPVNETQWIEGDAVLLQRPFDPGTRRSAPVSLAVGRLS